MSTADLHDASAFDPGTGALQVLLTAGPGRFVGDLPKDFGGLDIGPNPHDLLAAALAACTTQTMRLYIRRKGWAVGEVMATVDTTTGGPPPKVDLFTIKLTIAGDLTDEQRQRLLEIAEKCPVHRLLGAGATITTELVG
jgi:putative redox protein